ncbi:MAG: hypothetical protein HOJ16_05105 [Candidatus Peribacter sp.]|jgi:hypothetical protein|nr:hypothetical protein [Candidatus Peribacter sp.]
MNNVNISTLTTSLGAVPDPVTIDQKDGQVWTYVREWGNDYPQKRLEVNQFGEHRIVNHSW